VVAGLVFLIVAPVLPLVVSGALLLTAATVARDQRPPSQ
jgi:hypothetical protein